MNKETIKIAFGGMSDPLSKQIVDQGFVYEKKGIDICQHCADAIVSLGIYKVLTPSEVSKARQRLMKDIEGYTRLKPSSKNDTRKSPEEKTES
jgi:hypothetical protein